MPFFSHSQRRIGFLLLSKLREVYNHNNVRRVGFHCLVVAISGQFEFYGPVLPKAISYTSYGNFFLRTNLVQILRIFHRLPVYETFRFSLDFSFSKPCKRKRVYHTSLVDICIMHLCKVLVLKGQSPGGPQESPVDWYRKHIRLFNRI